MEKHKVLMSEATIKKQIKGLRAKMLEEFGEGEGVVFVVVDSAALFFAADLLKKHMQKAIICNVICVRGDRPHFVFSVPPESFANKTVVLVDTIVDSGKTILDLADVLSQAKQLYSISLLLRKGVKMLKKIQYMAGKYVEISDFLYGYGLDDNKSSRSVPFIYYKK